MAYVVMSGEPFDALNSKGDQLRSQVEDTWIRQEIKELEWMFRGIGGAATAGALGEPLVNTASAWLPGSDKIGHG